MKVAIYNGMYKMVRIKKVSLWLLLAVLLSGCSFRFVYNHLDWWTNWYLDDYVELNEQQQKLFDGEFEKLHLWHRRSQLPKYSEQLKDLKLEINSRIDEPKIIQHLAALVQHWQNFLIEAEPKIQPLAYSLSLEQRQQLIHVLAENNQERLDDYEQLSDDAWYQNKAKEQQEQLKEWFGKLTKDQKAQVAIMSQDFKRSFEPWIEYRQQWTSQFADLLNGELPEHQFKFDFYRLFVNGRSLRSDEFNVLTAHNNQVFARIFVYIVTSANDKQRKRINKKLNKVIGDLDYLAKDD